MCDLIRQFTTAIFHNTDKTTLKTESIITPIGSNSALMGEYIVRCTACGKKQPQYALHCPDDTALLRTEYTERRLTPRDLPGIWTFYDWLPVTGHIPVGEKPVTYRSTGLSGELGLKNLFISFSGYWPERGAAIKTCSFKELESAPTMQRMIERGGDETLVVASAGNTARAFAEVAAQTSQKLLLVVPSADMHRIWITKERSSETTVIAVNGDYCEAISFAETITGSPGFIGEGGARNVARRDGMGTVMLDAALFMKKVPDHYFQAVGSGTGGISAYEAATRLIGDGRFGERLPVLHLSQNVPCSPLYKMWCDDRNGAGCVSDNNSSDWKEMYTDIIYNRKPPYAVCGGVADALSATGGIMYGVTNREAEDANRLFEETEEVDIDPAAAIAVAALMQAASEARIRPDDFVLLNITGGGERRAREDCVINRLDADIVVNSTGQWNWGQEREQEWGLELNGGWVQ